MDAYLEWTFIRLRPLRDRSAGFWYDATDVLLYLLYVRYRRRSWNGNDSALSWDNWMRSRQGMPLKPARDEV